MNELWCSYQDLPTYEPRRRGPAQEPSRPPPPSWACPRAPPDPLHPHAPPDPLYPHAPPDPLHPHAPPPQSLSYQDLPKSLDLLAALAARSPGNESILQTLDYARKAGMMASVAMRPVSEIPGEGGERGGGRWSP